MQTGGGGGPFARVAGAGAEGLGGSHGTLVPSETSVPSAPSLFHRSCEDLENLSQCLMHALIKQPLPLGKITSAWTAR